MGLPDLLNHLLNFIAPAFWVALVVTLVALFFMKKQAVAGVLIRSIAINFVVCCLVLLTGLWLFGRDGKMSTYAAMTLLCATSQWILQRGWRA
jgi:Mn2+/Fe2+ NRAMP family transporter